MIARELEEALHKAFVGARDQAHKLIGVEHLLLALLDTPSASKVLTACGADLDALRTSLMEHIAAKTPLSTAEEAFDCQPTAAFQGVIQRAILKIQTSGKKEVAGVDVLLAILAEEKSHAAALLKRQGIVWLDAANCLSHDIRKVESLPRKPEEVPLPEGADLQVVLYNDDFTPMEFVVRVLAEFFGMTREDATETMLEIHREGIAVCGLYSREAAQEVIKQVLDHAAEHGYPLRCAAVAPK